MVVQICSSRTWETEESWVHTPASHQVMLVAKLQANERGCLKNQVR